MARVLLADDSPHAQRMGERILREGGHEVTAAMDGERALMRLSEVDPDVVLVDAFLPYRDGYELCDFIKSHPRFRHVRVVLTAGLLEPLDEQRARQVSCDAILKKPGRLTDEEQTVMRSHALRGAVLVESSSVLTAVAPIVRHHHERVDGAGYPDGLSGDAIPLAARIVAACDAFDAMANTRQYRNGMGVARAVAVLREHSGSQWDAAVVENLARNVEHLADAPTAAVLANVGRGVADIPAAANPDVCVCGDTFPGSELLLARQSQK